MYLLRALRQVLDNASGALHAGHLAGLTSFKAECVFPYRVLRALYDRPEMSRLVMEDVMMDLVWCLKSQLDCLGGAVSAGSSPKSEVKAQPPSGSHKKSGKRSSLKAEVVQSANLLFASMGQEFVWQWMVGLLEKQTTILAALVGGVSAMTESKEGVEGEEEEEEESAVKGSYAVLGGAVGRVDEEDCHRLRDERSLSPVSEMLESQLVGRKRKNKIGLEQPLGVQWTNSNNNRHSVKRLSGRPGLIDVLSLIKLLLHILPKVSL